MALSSDDVNYLIYRYLQESGFSHSAFTFSNESLLNKSTNLLLSGVDHVPPGQLINFLQKGLLYKEIETHLREDGTEISCDEAFTLTSVHQCQAKERKHGDDHGDPAASGYDKMEEDSGGNTGNTVESEGSNGSARSLANSGSSLNSSNNGPTSAAATSHKSSNTSHHAPLNNSNDRTKNHRDEDGSSGGISGSGAPVEISESNVTILRGHLSEVFICAWSPTSGLLASGSGDSTARIWSIPNTTTPNSNNNEPTQSANNINKPLVLKHLSKEVTTLDWNGDGSSLATGSYDGLACIWNNKGELLNKLNKHNGPIFSLKWNKKGDYLLTGSVDHTAIIWDVKSGDVKQQFQFHKAPTLDVDWRNNASFATCSTDKMIYVCELGKKSPLKCFSGHQDEVNAIKWDPSGNLLASCSDDYTAKIWSLKQDKYIHDLKEHAKEIYTIKWSPTGPGTDNPNKPLVLASASFDATIKLWDVEVGTCVYSLTKHTDPVYSVAFSPNGEFLVSGSFDRCLHIWSVKDGTLLKTYRGSSGIYEVCWNNTGTKIAACLSNSTVCVVDIRSLR